MIERIIIVKIAEAISALAVEPLDGLKLAVDCHPKAS